MLSALGEAFLNIFNSASAFYLVGGVLLGLIVGILPGFGGTVGLAILLPFIYGMDPLAGLALMIGVMSVVTTSDTFPAVLIGIPGSVGSQATVLDGYPLAKRGQAARALAAGFTASLFGGVFGAIVLTLVIQAARPLVLSFGTGEMLMLAVLGLSMVGVLSGTSFIKGLISAMLGLVIGMVGVSPTSNEYRMEFEYLYLSNGIPLMVIAIAIFAIPEIVDLLRRNTAISETAKLSGSWWQGVKDAFANKFLVLRCASIGTLIGILPGLGGAVVDWIAYAHAVQTSKDRENFGNGDIRGVLAPESANNAKEGGALVPTLIFGIPGSGGTAILLGGMILLGVEPGVTMITNDLGTVYTIIWSLALANVLGASICVLMATPISKLTTINVRYLAPFLIALILFAAFQSSEAWGDLFGALIIGVLAIYMRRYGFPRAALMIGFVLSDGLETNFYQTYNFYGWGVFERPIFLSLIVITVVSLWAGWRMLRIQKQEARPSYPVTTGQYVMALFMAGVALFALIATQTLSWRGNMFPEVIGIPMLGLCLLLIYRLWRNGENNPDVMDEEALPETAAQYESGVFQHILAILGLVATAWLIGYWLATGLFVFFYLYMRSRVSLAKSLLGSAVVLVVFALMAYLLGLEFARGLIQETWELPFPLSS